MCIDGWKLIVIVLALLSLFGLTGCMKNLEMTPEQVEAYRQQAQAWTEFMQDNGVGGQAHANLKTQPATLIEGVEGPLDIDVQMSAQLDPVKAQMFQALLDTLEHQRAMLDRFVPEDVED